MNKLIASGWLAAFMSLPAMAQDETAPAEDAAAPTEEAAPAADAAPAAAESPAETEAPAADDSSASTDSSSSDTSSTDSSSSDSSSADSASSDDSASSSDSADSGGGHKLYVGLDYDSTTIDFSDNDIRADFGHGRVDSDFAKLRLGWRVFDAVGLEVQAGVPITSASDDKAKTKEFFAAYIAPTGVLFETLEVSARIGYAYSSIKTDNASKSFDGMSYGLSLELPIRAFGESLPNVRIVGGGTVYHQDRESRIFGFNAGLRYDFTL